jgi:hypothetical protein
MRKIRTTVSQARLVRFLDKGRRMADPKGVRSVRASSVLAVAFACGACADGEPSQVAPPPNRVPVTCDGEGVRDAAGSEGSLDHGTVTILDTVPALASAGDNRWHVRITDTTGEPVAGASVALTAFMPVHGHASPKVALSEDEGDGSYLLAPVALSMPGVWLVDVMVESDAADGRATFSICVGP